MLVNPPHIENPEQMAFLLRQKSLVQTVLGTTIDYIVIRSGTT